MMPDPDFGQNICQQDNSLGPDSAEALVAGTPATGFICPNIDEDWFTLDIPTGQSLLRINLSIDNARSPIEATYSIAPAGSPEMSVAIPDEDEIGPGANLRDTHCLEPGAYTVVLRDQGADAEDIRNAYELSFSTLAEPDTFEPNNEDTSATTIGMGAPTTGFISCRGDVDFYQFEVTGQDAVRVALDAAELGYEPQVTLFDPAGELVLTEVNARGALGPTALSFERQLQPGTYTVRVSDDNEQGSNAEVPYTLTIGVFEDPDTNEPNDGPLEATMLTGLGCGAGWSAFSENAAGALVTAADNDWFEIDLSGCANGIIEAEATLNTTGLTAQEAWELQARVQMSITLVRDAGPADPCDEDEDCVVLTRTCEENIDCSGLLEACQLEGRCGGAGVCLPTNTCGANQTFRAYTPQGIPEPIVEPPPPNTALLSAPVLSSQRAWLRVSDFQANGGDPRARYTLRVRVRNDPDGFEADNLYTSDPRLIDEGERVSPYTIHDCTAGDCCGGGDFVTAHIGYDGDRDYFMGSHPCEGRNCMLRLHYQVDAGDASPILRLTTSRGPWYDALLEPGTSGTIGDVGRPEGEDQCIVAAADQDLMPFDLSLFHFDPDEPGFLWDADQRVRFCLEVTSNDCVAPCIVAGDECRQR
ncbi:MAG: PPC domain-containing protein [Myxococcota bacterium]